MGDKMNGETQKGADEPRARAQPDPEPAPAGPGVEIETQSGAVETVAEPLGDMVAQLASRPGMGGKVVEAIERALTAKRWSFCRDTKQRIYEDDHRAQMDAAKLYLEYVVGRPVERSLVVTSKQGNGFDWDELMASPALRRALARRLETAEKEGVPKGG